MTLTGKFRPITINKIIIITLRFTIEQIFNSFTVHQSFTLLVLTDFLQLSK